MINGWILLISLCLVGCSPTSREDIQLDAKIEVNRLIVLLSAIETKEDLLKQSSKIKKQINILVDMMIKANEFAPSAVDEFPIDKELSDKLKYWMVRLYEIDGAPAIMETLQRDGLHKIDQHLQVTKALED
ncbi:MAG: hypothetical protein HY860_01410 [Chlamydiales bacterium]|nr:hypothetical protein [Chlamydiales bacterium]